jgi:myosin heavy subunit
MSYFVSRLLERQDGVDDLCMISTINDATVCAQLKTRLDKSKIYTNIGNVLVAVNPYTALPIYGGEHVRMYQSASLSDSSPHVYGLAERAYRSMVTKRQPQAVIISGESGAGKTESAKLLLHYVSSVSGNSKVAQFVKNVILDCNPLLESFGNAKTVRYVWLSPSQN